MLVALVAGMHVSTIADLDRVDRTIADSLGKKRLASDGWSVVVKSRYISPGFICVDTSFISNARIGYGYSQYYVDFFGCLVPVSKKVNNWLA